jgi:hypothetical protein
VYPVLGNVLRGVPGLVDNFKIAASRTPYIGPMLVEQALAPINPLAAATVTPYSKAPNSLMGFSKDPYKQKGFTEYKYKVEIPVKITLPSGEVFYDNMNGLNKSHALERARRNWDGSSVEMATQKDVDDFYGITR